jgi:hypothetical protein
MKPTLTTNRTSKRYPITECNYHSLALDGFNGRCAKVSVPSFRSISRDYFETEEPKSFLSEAALFATMMVTVAVPLVGGVFAIIELCRAFGNL